MTKSGPIFVHQLFLELVVSSLKQWCNVSVYKERTRYLFMCEITADMSEKESRFRLREVIYLLVGVRGELERRPQTQRVDLHLH